MPETAYVPCPVMDTDVAVQFGDDCPVEHNLTAVDPPEYVAPDEAVSSARTEIVCTAPDVPVEVFALATAAAR